MQFRKTATALTLSAAVLMGAGVPAATASTSASPAATASTAAPASSSAPAEKQETRDEDNGDWGLWGLLGLLGLGGLLGRNKKRETVHHEPVRETHRVDTTTHHTDGRVTDATDRLRGTDGTRSDGIPGNGR